MDERGRIRLPELAVGGLPTLYRRIARQWKETLLDEKVHIERAHNAFRHVTSILCDFGDEHNEIMAVPFLSEEVRATYLEAITPPITIEVADGEPWEGVVQIKPILNGPNVASLYRGADVIARGEDGQILLYKVLDNNMLNWQQQDASLDEIDQCKRMLDGAREAFVKSGMVPKGHSKVAWVSSMDVPIRAASLPST